MKFGRAAAMRWIRLSCKCAIASSFRTREAYLIVPLQTAEHDVGSGRLAPSEMMPELT